MADVQQQIADGARPLARVGDVIEWGQRVSANVVRLEDSADDQWHRAARDPLWFTCMGGDPVSVAGLRATERWWPMTVVEVDPEPQPVGRWLHDCGKAMDSATRPGPHACAHCGNAPGPWRELTAEPQPDGPLLGLATTRQLIEELKARRITAPSRGEAQCLEDATTCLLRALTPAALDYRTAEPRDPGPVVLSLPQVPDGAVALIGAESGKRWVPIGGSGRWQVEGTTESLPIYMVIGREGSVTVEFARPREPRVWEQIDVAPDGEPDLMVEVEGYGRFARNKFGHWVNDDHSAPSFHALRELGDVREVLA